MDDRERPLHSGPYNPRSRGWGKNMTFRFAGTCASLMLVCGTGSAADAPQDEALFKQFCAACHAEQPAAAGTANERAPTIAVLKTFTAEAVLNALTNGKMQPQGLALSDAQRRMVSEYSSGKRLSAAATG